MFDMPFRGSKIEEKTNFAFCIFLENAMNSLSVHVALSEFVNIAGIYAFSDELAKHTYCAKRVHLLGMNIHLPDEIPVAKRG